MERIIKVTGKGKISVKPDLIRLLINLEDKRETYEETVEQSTLQLEMLRDCFAKLGFERADLKTINFNVNTEYESYQDENRAWKQKFIGYKFVHAMMLEFDADNKRLGEVLYALAHAPVCPEFRINYTVKDMEAAKNKLLAKAVADSKEKAKVLAEAAGVALGDIVKIDYSWGELEIFSAPVEYSVRSASDAEMDSYSMDIEPDDIDVTDTVTVVWEIG